MEIKKLISTGLLLMAFSVTFGDGFVLPDFCEGKNDGFYADPLSCAWFYLCQGKSQYHFKCNNGLRYDERCRCCNYPENVPCDDDMAYVKTYCTCRTGASGFKYKCSLNYVSTDGCAGETPCYDGRNPSSVC